MQYSKSRLLENLIERFKRCFDSIKNLNLPVLQSQVSSKKLFIKNKFFLPLSISLLFSSNILFGQLPDPISCDDTGVPAFNLGDCSNGVFVGSNIDTRDNNENFIANVNQTDIGGATEVLVEDGTEYCDHDGNTGLDTEGPDIIFNIPVAPEKRQSCEAGVLTITLRGDFNNSCEVAYIVNECGIIISQSQLTGLPEGDKCDVIFPLQVSIPAADLSEAAADGVITFSVRTNGGTAGFQGSEVDGTCGPGRGVDCVEPFGVLDGNCIALHSFVWPIQTTAEAGTLNSTDNIICDGESIDIDVLNELMFDDPNGTGALADSDPSTGSYHLDFYYDGGPNPANPYPSDGGTAGDLINVYNASTGSNPQVTIVNDGGSGIQDHSNTNAPLTSGGGALPSNTLIEVIGSVWGDSNVEPIGEGSCFGEILSCGDHTNYISFVLLEPITANASCTCIDGNTGVVTISGFDGGLPEAVTEGATPGSSDYILQATGGTLSSSTVGVGGNVRLTLDPGETNWSVTVIDEEGCEFHLNGSCGIEEEAQILFPTYVCLVNEALDVSVSPSGGTLSGPGVVGSTFNPAIAGIGTHTLEYDYQEGSCEVSTEINVTVEDGSELDASFDAEQLVCADEVVTLTPTEEGGVFTGIGVSDNGDGTGGTFSSSASGDYVVTYSLNTSSGCSVVYSLIITVDGNKPIIMIPPSDLILECGESGNTTSISNWVSNSGGMMVVDDSPEPVDLSSVVGTATETCGNSQIIPYTFTAEDECGNSISVIAYVRIIDTTPPDFKLNSAVTIDCDDNTDPDGWAASAIVVEDECDDDPITNYALINIEEKCDGTVTQTIYTYVFSVADACGNQSTSMTSTYTIEDSEPPQIIPPTNLNVTCDQDISLLVTEWLDDYNLVFNCFDIDNPIVTTDYIAGSILDACGDVIPVTWTVETICGAFVTATSNINIIEDTTGPTMTCTPSLTFAVDVDNCGANIALPLPLSTDCNEIESILQTSPPPNEELPIGITSVIFTATDECGNTSTCSTNVTIVDTQNPELICPPSINVCSDEGTCSWVSNESVNPLVSDCGNTTLSYSIENPDRSVVTPAEIEGFVFMVGSSSVTVTATDVNGNTTACNFTVNVEDCEAPVITCPDDITVECDSDVPLSSFKSEKRTSISQKAMMDCNCTATQGTQSFPITTIKTDEDAVSFYSYGNPDAASANTGFELINTTLLFLHEDTNTGEISLVVIMDAPSGDGGSAMMDFFCLPANATLDLSDDNGEITGIFPTVSANFNWADCCTDGTVIGNVGCNTTFDFIPTIGSGINNMAWVTGTEAAPIYTYFDNFSEPVRIQCGSGQPECCQNSNMVTTEDSSCPNLADGSIDVTTDADGAPFTFLWSTGATSEDLINVTAGNYTVTITDKDNCEQILDVEVGLTQTCDSNDALDLFEGAGNVIDNCDPVEVTSMLINTISGCGSTQTLVYEYSAIDSSGNQSSCYAYYTIEDTTTPLIGTAAMDMTVECDGAGNSDAFIGWLANKGGATATDICGPEITWTNNYTSQFSDECGLTGEIDVIFTVTDDCSNTSTTEATFTIEDTTAPTLDCPSNITLECSDPLNDAIISNWLSTANASDVCGNVTLANDYADTFEADCGLSGEYTVVFTATDACTNETTCSRTITIEDTTDPIIELGANDLILECAGVNNAAQITAWTTNNGGAVASDNCSAALTWSFAAMPAVATCGNTTTTTYVFTVTDACDNTSTTTADVILEDTTHPVLTVPTALIEECGDITTSLAAWRAQASATDACGNVTIVSELWNTTSGCGGTESRTYLFTATDACGNETTGLSDYILEDTVDPVVTCPSDLALVCGNESNDLLILNWLNSATAVDVNGCSDVRIENTYPNALPGLACQMSSGLTVTFTATDGCANTHTCQATITMDDSVAPYFENCPSNMTVNVDVDLCETNVIYSTPIALDDCDESVKVEMTSGIASGSAFPIGTTSLLFTATDDCGNTQTCAFDITVVDSDVPSIACPSNNVVVCVDAGECTWQSTDEVDALFNENCAAEGYTVTYVITGATSANSAATGINDPASDDVEFELGTSEVCYTITDDAGNSASCCFDVIVEDCEDPSITCPVAMTVECDGSGNTTALNTWLASVAGDDNCDTDVSLSNSLFNTISDCNNAKSYVYSFESEDNFGNVVSCLSTFTIEDTTSPEIETAAMDMTIECSDGDNGTEALLAWLNDNGGAEASDVCNGISWSNDFDGIVGSCGETGEVSVIFTVTDDCGNTSTTEATFTIEDTTAPTLDCPSNITLECSDPLNDAIISNWLSTANASDVCGNVTLANDYADTFEADCGLSGEYTVVFTATDACTNETTCSRTITIEDTTDPIIELGANDLILECAGVNNAAQITAWTTNNGGAVASDNCSAALTWSFAAMPAVATCGNTTTTTYVFTVTDACDNTSTTTADVILEDTTPPLISGPDDVTVQCNPTNNPTELNNLLAAFFATDNCDMTPIISNELYNSISGCGGTSTETYLITAVDDCGNQSSQLFSFTIIDSNAPTLIQPNPLTIECGNPDNPSIIQSWLDSFTGTDFCGGDVIVTNNFNGNVIDGCGVSTNVSFNISDECGNNYNFNSTITIDDTLNPYFENCPSNMTVNVDVDLCETNVIYSTPIALDDCDESVNVEMTSGIASGSAFPIGTTSLLFTATDDCGNTQTCAFDITVVDSDVPSITCPSNNVVVCVDADACTWQSTDEVEALFNENCAAEGYTVTYVITGATSANSAATGINDPASDDVEFELGTSEVCYTITDDAGNSASCCFDVIVEDCEDPSITCPVAMTVECDGSGNTTALNTWLASVAGDDNCDTDVSLSNSLFNTISDCNNAKSYVYSFESEDNFGNVVSCLSTFTIEDTTSPEIETAAMDMTIECSDGDNGTEALLAWLNDNGGAEASDVCNGISWSNDFDGIVGSCGETGEVSVIFTVTDDCGNTSTTEATFTIEDTTAPTLDCPSNITLECSDPLNDAIISNWLSTANASDVCGNVTLANDYADTFEADCGLSGEYTVVFTATDACTNETTCSRTITIEDTTDPIIELGANDLILECAGVNNAAQITAWTTNNGGAVASDNCSAALTWSFAAMPAVATCGNTTTTTYVFTVTDACDNTSTTTADVILEDTTHPVLTVPTALIEECGDITTSLAAWRAQASATDACGNVTIVSELWNTTSGCGGTESRTYLFTATDACGNETTGLSDYILEDTVDPVVTCPSDLALVCGNESNDLLILNWLNSATAVDVNGCSDVRIENTYPNALPGLACQMSSGLTVTFTATDGCANTHTCQATITMDDSVAPYFENCPSNMTVNVDVDLCETNVIYSTPIALDDCDESVKVEMTSGIASGSAFPIGTTSLLFTATDDCGNTQTCAFDITVVDSDVPSIACPSNNVVVCVDAGECTWQSTDEVDALFNENCAAEGYTVTYVITGATSANSAATGINDPASDDVEFELGTSEVCYTITDDAGNSASCCFDVIVEDCEDPSITCPVAMTVECDGSGNTTALNTWLASVAGDDNCDTDVSLSNSLFNTISDCNNAKSYVYSFESEDNFGNVVSCLSTFTIEDTTSPEIETAAMDMTIECSDGDNGTEALLAWLNDNGGAEASDVCNGISWSNDFDGIVGSCGETGEVSVIFTVTDDCGNTSTTEATFTIEDTTAPTLDCPSNITLECSDPLNDAIISNWLSTANASDVCGNVTLANDYADTFEADCGLSGEYTVVFTATDACTNETTCSRTITIEDTTDPIIELGANDLILECAGVNNAAQITAWTTNNGGAVASDNCSAALTWSFAAMPAVATCGNTTTTTYVFTVTDACDNTSTTTADVILEDTTPPLISGPDDVTVQCNPTNNPTELNNLLAAFFATDNCDMTPIISNELYNSISGCGGTSTETYLITAVDDCGNQSSQLFSFTIIDSNAPTLIQPNPLTIECGNPDNPSIIQSWLDSFTGTDFCGGDVIVTNNFNGNVIDGCGVSTNVSFNISDECGNNYNFNSTITIDDTLNPYFENCPSNMTVNVDVDLCETNVIYSTPIALDDCDESVNVEMTSGIASGSAFPIGTTSLLFTATDDCGNTQTCAFDITVVDSDVPSITCPSNNVVVCVDADACTWQSTDEVEALFNENCAAEGYTVTYVITGATSANSAATGINDPASDDVEFELGTSEVCYTITDDAGNSASCCFDVIVEDCEDPSITCPVAMTVECDGSGNTTALNTWLASVAGDDNCDTDVSLSNSLFNTISDCNNAKSYVYSFESEDNFGNVVSCLSTFTIEDTTSPEIETAAMDMTIECSDGDNGTEALLAWLNDNGGAEASDVCNGISWSNDFDGIVGSCGETGEVSVIFTVTDDCGNTSTTEATFTIEDTTAPTLDCPSNITLECSDPLNDAIISNWLSTANASDVCGNVTLANDYADTFEADCGLSGEYTVVFTATDACTNETTCSRTITIEDTTDPIIELGANDLILECAGVNNAAQITAWTTNNGGAVASDNCSAALTWSFAAMPAVATCGNTTTTTYVFTVTDACDNTSTTTADVILEDTTHPVLTVPTALIEECGDITTSLAAWRAQASATDACGNVTIVSELWNTTSGCGGTESRTYLFTATDACGNATTGLSDYVLEDTGNPTVICPDNLALVCGEESNDQLILSWLNSATSSDLNGCSDVIVTNTYPNDLPGLDCNLSTGLTITFTATDACGNSHTCESIITMDDDTPPFFENCPSDLTVNVDVDLCSSNVIYSQPVVSDNCDEMVQIELTDGIASGQEFPLGITSQTFTATDDCGNTQTCTFLITVLDSDIPSIDCPSNDVIQCTNDSSCTWLSDKSTDPLYIDNCTGFSIEFEIMGATTANGDSETINIVAEQDIIFNLGTSEVCYTISDPSGNNSQCCFDVVVKDCEAPTITCSDAIDVACGSEDLNLWFNSIAGTALDNCNSNSELTIDTLLLTDISSCGNTFERVYLFTVSDKEGNASTCVATYETDDTVNPIITQASDLILECDDSNQSTALLAWLNNNGGATATDACSEPIVWSNNFIGDLSNGCSATGDVEVVFTATDDCGNLSTTSAVFRIEDNVVPELNVPEDLTLECSDAINTAVIENWLNSARAEDECSGTLTVSHNYPDVFVAACGLTGTYTVTWTTTDPCGNTTTDSATITLVDTTEPNIDIQAQDLVLECADPNNTSLINDWLDNNGLAVATDLCSDQDLVWSHTLEMDLDGCGDTETSYYIFTVTDNCGNQSSTRAKVIIEDTTAPQFDILPQDLVIECSPLNHGNELEIWLSSNGGAEVSDLCSDQFEWAYDLINVTYECDDNGVRTYRFIVTDECGNTSSAEADFILIDTTPPLISKSAEDFTAECNGSSNAIDVLNWLNNNGFAEATDICGNVTWSNNYGSIAADCGSTGEVEVTFTATDECGNSSTTTSIFTINDTTPPAWTILPQDFEIECDGTLDPMGRIEAWLNTAGGAEAEDDCSLIVYSNDFNDINIECDIQGGVEVTFTITDACGNFSTASANLSITDDVAPEISSPAKSITVECDGTGNQAELQLWLDNHGSAEAYDVCSDNLTWNYTLMNSESTCGLTQKFIYMFTATDACGNESNNTIAEFIIEDTTRPEFSIPPSNLTVECDGGGNKIELNNWLNSNASGLAADICTNGISWEWDLIREEDDCGFTGRDLYRFTIQDDCGNVNSAEAWFNIIDTTNPLVTGGEDMLMEECNHDANGNYPEFDFWLTNNAGLSSSDICGLLEWSNDYDPSNWMTICGNTQFVDVEFTATDECGNSTSVIHRFGIGDVTPPQFINCPRPPIVVDAPDSWCSAYVNYDFPIAEDNCGDVTVTQTDNTNYNSGDLFPVGTTILTFVAEDDCGNTSYCEYKISVNDFHTPPVISCPSSLTVNNDPKMCGAIVNGIAPTNWEDNCPNNVTIQYEIIDENDDLLYCGFEDASGIKFPVGTSQVNYRITDQPLLLITELVQNGDSVVVEITNFGPANLDISCLNFRRDGTNSESHNVPNNTILNVGSTYLQGFSNIPSSSPASYWIEFIERPLDGVSINGHTTSNFIFSGDLTGAHFIRNYECDHDLASDFRIVSDCFIGSLGVLNEGFSMMSPNGTTVGIQEGVFSEANCSFEVTVLDDQAPFCAEYDTTRYILDSPINILPNACTYINYDVPFGITVGDVNLIDLEIDIIDGAELNIFLTSPSGTTIDLLNGNCVGSMGINISLDDMASEPISNTDCNTQSSIEFYQPLGLFADFYNENAGGSWILRIENVGGNAGQIQNGSLEILELLPYSQSDIVINNDPGDCGAIFNWRHPLASDNCGLSQMTMHFESNDNISLPPAGDVRQGELHSAYFEVGSTTVIYTMIDEYGNKSQCSFEVIVNDAELPLINPDDCVDQVIQLGPGECEVAPGDVILPTPFDNCGSQNLSNNLDLSNLISGSHGISYFYIDEFDNLVECTFNITVLPYIPSTTQIACVGQINMSLGPDCMETITPDMILVPGGDYGCTDDYCLTLMDEDGNEFGNSIDGTNVVDESHVGQLIQVKVCFDCNGSNCCWGYLLVENKLIPQVVCPEDVTIACNQAFNPEVTGQPAVESCEQQIYFSYQDNLTRFDMCEDITALLERKWYVTDESNNVIECIQNIQVEGFDINDIVIPADTVITQEIACEVIALDQSYLHPDSTGWATIGGVAVAETGDGLCSHFWNYEDQILYNCEGSYEIIRKWMIRDMCDEIDPMVNPILEKYQSIKVLDNMPPQFDNCPDDIEVASNGYDCTADIYLNDYFPDISELCGSIKDTLITVTPGSVMENPKGHYYLTNLSAGQHTVKISVRDQCSNYSRCTFNINVVDQSGPNLICDQNLHISLSNAGIAELNAEIFNDGSFDNCTALDFLVYRMESVCGDDSDIIPGESIKVCCADVGPEPIQVILRAWDDADGNQIWGSEGDYMAECMVNVSVSDFPIADFKCPNDITLNCHQDYTNLNLTGAPASTSICNALPATFVDEEQLIRDCSSGQIIRTWTVTATGQECKQTITLQGAELFSEDNIVWPSDFDGTCSEGIPEVEPQIDLLGCSVVGINLESDTFYFQDNVCFKILNTWTVIDWCQRPADALPNDPIGMWTHIQEIKITETEGPVIQSCDNFEVSIQDDNCLLEQLTLSNSAIDNSCGFIQDVDWTYQIDLDNDGDFELEGNSQSDVVEVPLQNLEVGQLNIVWAAFDGCNNFTSCTQSITIHDGKAPTAYCVDLTAGVMANNGELTIWANDFDAGSTDNCTVQSDLIFSFDAVSQMNAITFDCDDIPNGISQMIDVTLWVTDASGNQSNCTASIELQDNNNACPDNSNIRATVGGHIETEMSEPVMEVETYLKGPADVDEMDMTEVDGVFEFENIPYGGFYQIRPYKNKDFLNGISTIDLLSIQSHILGSRQLASPYKIIAADVTHDDKVSALDLLELRNLILGRVDTFTNNTSWRFVDQAFEFLDASDPFPFDDYILKQTMQIEDMENDFIAVKIGDVNNTAITNLSNEELTKRTDYNLIYSLDIESHEKGQMIPVFTTDQGLIHGFQMQLELDNADFIEILSGSTEIESDHYYIDDKGILNISWHSVEGAVSGPSIPLFYLNINPHNKSRVELSLLSERIQPEIYLTDNWHVKVPSLSLKADNGMDETFVLYQNEPNPFTEQTSIKLYLPKSQEVKFEVHEANGRVIYSESRKMEAGENKFELTKAQIGTNGILYYTVTCDAYSETKKMIVLK